MTRKHITNSVLRQFALKPTVRRNIRSLRHDVFATLLHTLLHRFKYFTSRRRNLISNLRISTRCFNNRWFNVILQDIGAKHARRNQDKSRRFGCNDRQPPLLLVNRTVNFIDLGITISRDLRVTIGRNIGIMHLMIHTVVSSAILQRVMNTSSFKAVRQARLKIARINNLYNFLLILRNRRTTLRRTRYNHAVLSLTLLVLRTRRSTDQGINRAGYKVYNIRKLTTQTETRRSISFRVFLVSFSLVIVFVNFQRCGSTHYKHLGATLQFNSKSALRTVRAALMFRKYPCTIFQDKDTLNTSNRLRIFSTTRFNNIFTLRNSNPATLFHVSRMRT